MLSAKAPPSGVDVRVRVIPEVIGAFLESFTVPANVNPFNPLGAEPEEVG